MGVGVVRQRAWRGLFAAALVAFFFATMPVAARKIHGEQGIDLLSLLSARFLVGAILLWVFRPRREGLWPTRQEWRWLGLAMAGLCATSGMYFLALRTVPAATAILLIYTYPAFTAIMGRLWFGEPIGLKRGAALVVTFIGSAALMGWSRHGMGGVPFGGMLLAAGGGLTYSLFSLGSQHLMRARSPIWVNRWCVTGASLAYLVIRPPITWASATASGYLPLLLGGLYLGLMTVYLANTLFLKAIQLVGATRAGLYSTMEPLFTALLAWLILQESLGGGQLFGAILVLLGVLGLEGLEDRARDVSYNTSS